MEELLQRLATIWTPHAGQREFLIARAETKVLACGRRWGKTDACAVELLAKFVRDLSFRGLVVAPTLDQARLVFDRFCDLLEAARGVLDLPLPKIRGSPFPQLTVEDRRVAARSGHRPRSLRGHEADHIVVDEAAFLPEGMVGEVLAPMMATTAGTLTLASTPNGFNGFWRRFIRGRPGGPIWSRSAPSSENPRVRPEFLAAQREVVSERTYAVEYEAKFEAVEGQIFPPTVVERALAPHCNDARGDVYIGVDWGQHEDYTAVCVVQGTRSFAWLLETLRLRRLPQWQSQIDRVAEVIARYPFANVRCDSTGTQDSLMERLRESAPRASIHGLDFAGGRKAVLIDRLASQFDRDAFRMRPNPILQEELASFTARRSPSGHTRMEAATGHDDMVVALAMAVFDLPSDGAPRVSMGDYRRFF